MTLSEELKWRGLVNQTTYKDIKSLDKGRISFYLGVDPSSDSMTIGNLAAILLARRFVNFGHRAYMLVGGATGLIGDPDGKADERNLKTLEEVNRNKRALLEQCRNLFAGQDIVFVDNYSWFKNIKYIDFLRKIGKHAPMGQMIDREFIRSRLGEKGGGISYAEFSYALIQGYDFVHLSRKYDVSLQLCGSDQWGNAVAGVDLARRIDGRELNVYSTPLVVNKTTGVKFGKSEDGAVWLDRKKTSVYKFYQFWLNVDDDSVIDYLKIYTFLDKEKINELAKETKQNPSARVAQKTLAHNVTTLVHGDARTIAAEKVTDVLFGGAKFESLGIKEKAILAKEIPTVSRGLNAIDVLIKTSLASSKGEARRLIDGGAISINGCKIEQDMKISKSALLKKGKNNFILIK